jgi:hypothetical protein
MNIDVDTLIASLPADDQESVLTACEDIIKLAGKRFPTSPLLAYAASAAALVFLQQYVNIKIAASASDTLQ